MTENQSALLVVDDNEDNRYTLMRRLKREGYTDVSFAENGQEALDRAPPNNRSTWFSWTS